MHVCSVAQFVLLFSIPWTVACQTPLSMGFSSQEFWSGLRFPVSLEGIFLTQGLNLASSALAGKFFATESPEKPKEWFQIGKGVHQGCMLSPCLLNLYAEYIM